MEKTKATVRICGQEFRLSANESAEYLKKIADYVDQKAEEVQRAYPRLSTTNCVLLAALELSDELHKTKEKLAALDSRIDQLRNLPRTQSEYTGPVKRPFESKTPTTVK